MSTCPSCGGRGWIWIASTDPDDGGKDTCPNPDCSFWQPLTVTYKGGAK